MIAKTQAEKFGFVFGDGLMVVDYKPIKPTCANYERDNVESIIKDEYGQNPLLSEMEQNIADYLTTVFPYEKQENIINGLLKHYDYVEVYPVFQRLHYKGKNKISNLECQDAIVESVRQKLLDRSNVGIKKYNTTLDSNNTDNYLKHAQGEAMDLSNYLEKLMQQKEDITQIVAKYPNNMELGSEIRKIYGK